MGAGRDERAGLHTGAGLHWGEEGLHPEEGSQSFHVVPLQQRPVCVCVSSCLCVYPCVCVYVCVFVCFSVIFTWFVFFKQFLICVDDKIEIFSFKLNVIYIQCLLKNIKIALFLNILPYIFIHPSIHFLYRLSAFGSRGPGAYPSQLRV